MPPRTAIPRAVTPVRYLTPHDVGDIFGISYPTIRRMLASNHLKSVRIHPGKHYKIPASEVLRYAEEHNIPLADSHRKLLEEMTLEFSGLEINSESNTVEASA